jgi:hypothetical protein
VARRSILGKLIGKIANAFRGEPERKPAPIITPPTPPILGPLRRQVANRMVNLSDFANRKTIAKNVRQMTVDDLRWTMSATDDQLRNKARADADRLLTVDGGLVPLNPWWYR